MINLGELKLRLLLIEDDYTVRDVYKRIITSLGFIVDDYENAESAWDSYQNEDYAIVLTDWELPGISGFDFCLKIKKKYPDKSLLILITGYDDKDKLDKIMNAGIDDYIVKGASIQDLKIRLSIAAKLFNEKIIIKKSSKSIKKYKNKINNIHYDFNQIFNSVSEAIIIIDNDLNITHANRAFINIFNIKEPVIIKKCYDVFKNSLCLSCENVFKEQNKNICPVQTISDGTERKIELTLIDNQKSFFLYSVLPFTDEQNVNRGKIFVFKNITDKILLEERYKSLFEESKDMIITTSLEGDIIEINKSGLELLGFKSFSKLKDKSIFKFYENPEDKNYFNKQIQKNGFVKDSELILKRNDGSKIFVLVSSIPIRNGFGNINGYISIMKDISKRIANEQNTMRLNCELAEINKKLKTTQMKLVQQEKLASLGQLSAGIAHEINNPLGFIVSNFSSIRNYFENIHDYINKIDQTVKSRYRNEITEKIYEYKEEFNINYIFDDLDAVFSESDEGFERIISIISNLKNFSRQDSVQKFESCDFNSLIETTMTIVWNEIKYFAEVKKELHSLPQIKCIRNELNQVLLNIIINATQAIKSKNEDKLGIITIRTDINEKEKNIICSISDNGPGIPLEIIGKIFDPFFTTKESGHGTGLGLSISYEIIVNKHNGNLSVKSSPGEGTEFIIKLPIAQKTTD